jgi:NADH-quinone oxidoreductase subunit A
MLETYFPVLVFIVVGLLFGCAPVLLGWLVSPNRPDAEKLSPFECGFPPFGDARVKFDVRYYLIAILFILFDLEIAFLFPWASIFGEIVAEPAVKLFGFIEMMVFIAILVVGYVYAWARGALDWE